MYWPVAATIPNDGYRHHIGLRPYCGICGSVMIIGERFVTCEFEPIPAVWLQLQVNF